MATTALNVAAEPVKASAVAAPAQPEDNRFAPKGAIVLGLHAASAGMASVAAARSLGLPYPLYALIAAVIVSDSSIEQTRKLGIQRLAGTAFGAIVGALLSLFLDHSEFGIGLGIFLMIFVCHKLRLGESAKLAGYVAGLVVLEHGDRPWHYAQNRFLETALGIGFAYLFGLGFQRIASYREVIFGKEHHQQFD